jgi:hypothetical protein
MNDAAQERYKPRSVSLAVIFALAISVAGLVQGVNALTERNHLTAGLKQVGEFMSVEQAIYRTRDLEGSLDFAVALGFGALVLFVPLAYLISRGRSWARVVALILGAGLIIGQVVLMSADGTAVKTGRFVTEADVPGGAEAMVDRLNGMIVHAWFPPVHYVAEFLVLFATIALIIQLIRPTTTDFFRHEPPDEETATDDRVWSTSNRRQSTEAEAANDPGADQLR